MSNCQHCNTPIPPGAPAGICPACLIELGQAQPSVAGNFATPTVAELQGRIPGIELIELIGRGGMGAVYSGHQLDLDRDVAVKVLPQALSQDPAFVQRFRREAQTLAKLDHENIVRVFGSGVSDGLCYIVMEYIEGTTLREAIRAGAVEPEAAMRIVPQICAALSYAHQRGVVHRDIKPENILLGTGGRVKVADFGLAKISASERAETILTATGARLGTLRYMAPEQLDGAEVDHRADVYSLGVVFYELLTGEVPMGKFAMPSEKVATDPRIDDVVMRTLAREPAERYQRIAELETELQSLSNLDHDTVGWPPLATGQIIGNRLRPRGREWKTNASLFGLPVLHVAYGYHPRTGKKLVAKGLIAVGDIALGGIALGGVSLGVVSIGGVACGLNALGGCAFGLQMALGGCAIGGVAMGGSAIGLIAFGGAAVGVLAFGGGAAGYIVGGGGAAGTYRFANSPITDWLVDPLMPWLFTGAISLATIGPLAFVLTLVVYAVLRGQRAGQVKRVMPPEVRRSAISSVVMLIVLCLMFPIQAYTAAKFIQMLTQAQSEVQRAEEPAGERQFEATGDEIERLP